MSKPALFYTLVRRWHAGGFRVMRVTTEKRRQFYGSFVEEDMPTHCSPNQTVGRFETAAQAEAKVVGVGGIRAKYAPKLKKAREVEYALEVEQRNEIEAYITAPIEVKELTSDV